jgi:hypothetical protein
MANDIVRFSEGLIRSVFLTFVTVLTGSLCAQRFELGEVEGAFDDRLELPIILSTAVEVQAGQVVFEWDGSVGSGVVYKPYSSGTDPMEPGWTSWWTRPSTRPPIRSVPMSALTG